MKSTLIKVDEQVYQLLNRRRRMMALCRHAPTMSQAVRWWLGMPQTGCRYCARRGTKKLKNARPIQTFTSRIPAGKPRRNR